MIFMSDFGIYSILLGYNFICLVIYKIFEILENTRILCWCQRISCVESN